MHVLTVGDDVGIGVGDADGLALGDVEGESVGAEVGPLVGDPDGLFVGELVGAWVGVHTSRLTDTVPPLHALHVVFPVSSWYSSSASHAAHVSEPSSRVPAPQIAQGVCLSSLG
jgi:hypothetical protein